MQRYLVHYLKNIDVTMSSDQAAVGTGGDPAFPSPTPEAALEVSVLRKRSKKASTPTTAASNAPRKSKRLERVTPVVSSDPGEGLSRSAAGLSTVASGADLPMNAGAIREAMMQAFADPEFRKLLFQGPGTAASGSFVVPAVASETIAVTQPVVDHWSRMRRRRHPPHQSALT